LIEVVEIRPAVNGFIVTIRYKRSKPTVIVCRDLDEVWDTIRKLSWKV